MFPYRYIINDCIKVQKGVFEIIHYIYIYILFIVISSLNGNLLIHYLDPT